MGWRLEIGGGQSFRIAPIHTGLTLAFKRLSCAVAISYTTAPNAKMSVRASISFVLPSTCSGAMYCSVPRIVPSWVTASLAVAVGSWKEEWRAACILPQFLQGRNPTASSRLGQHDVARLEIVGA